MSLNDRTNEDIQLSMHHYDDGPGWLFVDVDQDSSVWPGQWVFLSLTDNGHDSDTTRITYEEAARLYDRLGRILGHNPLPEPTWADTVAIVNIYQREWEKGDPKVAPGASAKEQMEAQFRFRLAAALLDDGYRKVVA